MVCMAVLLGRAWCMICPLELVSNLSERIGSKFGITQKNLNKFIRSGAVVVFLYAIIQLLISGIHIHRLPAYTSFFLIGLLTLSVFIGLFYKDRAFCIGFCPIGMLLNAYGRGGMLAVRAGSQTFCEECEGKECIVSCNKNKFDGRSCPSLLNPPKLNSNRDCLVCGQCIKSCKPENMQLLLRTPFYKLDARETKASLWLTIFIIIVSGFVTYELTTEWKTAKEIFLIVPNLISNIIGWDKIGGLIKGIWTIGIFPLLMWILFGVVIYLLKGAKSIFESCQKIAIHMVIIISAGHMIKAIAKLNTWLGYYPSTFEDPSGESATKLYSTGILAPTIFISNSTISIIGLSLLVISLFYATREEKIQNDSYLSVKIIPKLILFILFSVIVAGIGFK